MSGFEDDVGVGSHGNWNQPQIPIRDEEEDKGFKTVQLIDGITAVYKNGSRENQEQEAKISMAEDSTPKSKVESETQDDKEKKEKKNNFLTTSVILTLCLVLLNFVLVLFVMHRTSEISSCCFSGNFSVSVNQTDEIQQNVDKMTFELGGIKNSMNSAEEKFESHRAKIDLLLNQTKIDEQVEALENENGELKRSHGELKEQFESLSEKVDELKSNISLNLHVLLVTSTPAETETQTTPAPQSNDQSITSCTVAMEKLSSPRSKKQTIYPHGNSTSLEVLCDFEVDGGGWTIIQKRTSGPKQEFNKTWNEYEKGFGSLDGNFWLGLENIRALTKNGDQELRIELEDWEGEKRWAKYSNFSVSDSSDFYRLSISGFSGDATDSLINSGYTTNYGMRFTTKDKDNDNFSGHNCAVTYGGYGGWWFNNCGGSGLNGLYFERGETVPDWQGVRWYAWKGDSYSLAKSEMKIRKKK